MRFATRLAAAVLGSGIAFAQAGHDDVVRVDPALKRLAGTDRAADERAQRIPATAVLTANGFGF